MSVNPIISPNAPAAIGPYSHAAVAGGFIFVSGQLPINPLTNSISDDIKEQTRQSLQNCINIINDCGAALEDVTKATIYIKDMNQFAVINEVYAEFFTNHKPARVCIEVARLPKDVLVEIDMIAYKEH